MKIGVLSTFDGLSDPELIVTAAQIAEEHEFASFLVGEHVVLFPEYASRYPYASSGRLQDGAAGILELFLSLTWIAAHTSRIRIGTGICIAAQRQPLYTAKQVSDLDYLSGGRLDFGIGIGWLREEYEALGVPWERRGVRTRECVEMMKSLWCDEVSEYGGEFYKLPPCLFNPKPVQKPHPPIYFGGESDAALRRVAELGDGWLGFRVKPDQLIERLAQLDVFLAEAGRSRDDIKIHVWPEVKAERPEDLAVYRDAGVDQVSFMYFGRSRDSLLRRAESLAKLQS